MKKKSKPEIPDECPFLHTCTKRVFKEEYEAMCDTSAWTACEWVQPKDYEQYQKQPSDWREDETLVETEEGVSEGEE